MAYRNAALDGLRGIAALAVVFHHVGLLWGRPIFTRGYLAVDLFFLLSGFVIAAAYEPRFAAGLRPLPYLWIRLKRLYPMVFIGAVVGLAGYVFFPMDRVSPWVALAASLVFVPVLDNNIYAFPLNVVQWSLWFEFVANAGHALVWRLSTAIWVGIAAASALGLIWIDWRHGDLNVGRGPGVFAAGFVRVAASFSLGVLVSRGRDLLPRLRLPYLPLVLACAIVLAAPRFGPDSLVILGVWPLLLVAALLVRPERWAVGPALIGGAISYPLYSVHAPILALGAGLIEGLPTYGLKMAALVGLLFAIVAISWWLAWLMEPSYPRRRMARARPALDKASTAA